MTDIEYLKKYLPSDKLEEGLIKLKKGIPVQYIVGSVNFCGNEILVNENVLIPRFETETLVEKTCDYVKEYFNKKISILELGTGSGNIAITLAKNLDANVSAIDISKEVLEVAISNAKKNNVKIDFYLSNVFSDVKGKYDVIISNPPYIGPYDEVEDIVLNNEPALALFAKNDGLEFYEKILKDAHSFINEKAIIAFEIGQNQSELVKNIAKKYFPLAHVKIEKDLPGKDRFVFVFIF